MIIHMPSIEELEAKGMTLYEAAEERHRLYLAMPPEDQYQQCLLAFERVLDWERDAEECFHRFCQEASEDGDNEAIAGAICRNAEDMKHAAERRASIMSSIEKISLDHAIPAFRPGQGWSGTP